MTATAKQVRLIQAREPLQIPYPANFAGKKTKDGIDEIFVSTQPRMMTLDEIKVVQDFIKTLPYRQSLQETGLVMISQDDPLLQHSHQQLDKVEADNSLPNTRYVPGSGQRSIYERVLIIRESGFIGNGSLAISAGV